MATALSVEALYKYMEARETTKKALAENTNALAKAREALAEFKATKANKTTEAKAYLDNMFENLKLASTASANATANEIKARYAYEDSMDKGINK
jgi:hypothetical protein